MDLIQQASGSNVGRMFATQAQLYPDAIALDCNDEQRTYAQLNAVSYTHLTLPTILLV